ncbi:hypothetical protein AGLY_015819 [Aphis glycines]|uniref:Transposable element P transposase-like RNase H domain-containing protein n=1 Tax=Aphis glycines TaxID=307491 RepID=A0A6G0SZK4_APHGL|nr:hypothetical protein AGLY_015819 [Aphis glycines]
MYSKLDKGDVAVFEKASSSFVVSNAEDASSVAKKSSGVLCKIGVKRANQLTPRCKSLYTESVILNKHLRCIKKRCLKFKDRLSVAEKMSDTLINSKLTSHMTKASAIFTRLQLRETNNKAKGRRFTLEEKLLSLLLYKRGAKSYDLLSKLFTLPGRRTLTNLLSKIPTDTGIDKTLIKVLKENVKNLSSKQRFCVVLFDEVSLDGNIQYNDSTGSISGFENNGLSRTQHFADHSLVFMIRGVVKKYKHPMSYTFCNSTTSSHDLAHQIRKVLQAIHLQRALILILNIIYKLLHTTTNNNLNIGGATDIS